MKASRSNYDQDEDLKILRRCVTDRSPNAEQVIGVLERLEVIDPKLKHVEREGTLKI